MYGDLRDAVRSIVKSPGFALVTILILAVAIGANSTIFTLVNALLLRDLPVHRPDQLVQISGRTTTGERRPFSLVMFEELGRRQQVLSNAVVYSGSGAAVVEINGAFIPSNLWSVDGRFHEELGQRPFLGRLLTPADADLRLATAQSVVVLGHGFWQQRFAGDPAVLGRELRIEGEPFTIVGVTMPGFGGMGLGEDPEITIPLPAIASLFRTNNGTPIDLRDRRRTSFDVTGRLKDGVTIAQARAQLEAIWPALLEASVSAQFGDRERQAFLSTRLEVQPASKGVEYFLRSRFVQPLTVLMIVVVLTLIIACVHLASIMLARAAARSGEIGLRLALGASRLRVCRPLVFESLLLSTAGAALGLAFAQTTSRALTTFMTQQYLVMPRFDLRPDLRVVAVTAGLAVIAGLLFALAPSWFATRQDPMRTLQTQSRSIRQSTGIVGPSLIVAQVALSLVVLTDAGLLTRSVTHLLGNDRGFDSSNLLIGRLLPRPHGYDRFDPASYYRALVERIGALPGVRSVSLSGDRPANGAPRRDTIDGRAVFREHVSPGFFGSIGLSLSSGRDFRWSDDERAPRVAVLNRHLATSLFGSGDPIGQHVQLGTTSRQPPIEIIAVVEDARLFDLRQPAPDIVFLPALQEPSLFQRAIVAVKVDGDPNSQRPAVAAAIDALGREYLQGAASLEQVARVGLVPERMTAGLAGFLAVVALVLACVGLYGLVSYTVALRTREIGIRMALGARATHVLAGTITRATRLVAIGVAVGIPLALATARIVANILYGIGPRDPLTIAGVAIVLLSVGSLAAYLPARRAARIDPMQALRCE